jgi:hypothetical protein
LHGAARLMPGSALSRAPFRAPGYLTPPAQGDAPGPATSSPGDHLLGEEVLGRAGGDQPARFADKRYWPAVAFSADHSNAQLQPVSLWRTLHGPVSSAHLFPCRRTWQTPCSSKEGNSMRQLFLTGLGVELGLAAVPSKRNQARPTPASPSIDALQRPKASATRHRASRSTGSSTNARAEPRYAQLRRESRE